MRAKVEIVGIEKLQLKIRTNLGKQAVKEIIKQNGAELQQKAQRNAPVGTPESTGIPGYIGGTLKRSIELEIKDGGMTAEVGAKAEYGAYVEVGTRFMDAQPYIKPAFDEQKVQFKKDMDRLVK